MKLNGSLGCTNFRDLGVSLSLVAEADIFPTGKLFRGGKIDYISDFASIDSPATILNLRRGADPQLLPTTFAHIPASNRMENYETANPEVQRWLNQVLGFFSEPKTLFPVFVHCTSGKDRTGVVIAAILQVVGIDRNWIIQEYLLSEGDVKLAWIETALDGMADVESYFRRVDLNAVRANFTY